MGRLQRAVGVFVFGAVLFGAALALTGIILAGRGAPAAADQRLLFGGWRLLYNTQAPATGILMTAAGVAVLCAAGVAAIERRVTNRSRRSDDPRGAPLAPKVVMRRTRGRYAGPMTVTVLIPAHNEQAGIGATLRSLSAQSRPPDRVIVVADNCTDHTETIARTAGVEVFPTVGNTLKKGGALNQALQRLLPEQGDNDLVVAMDADTTIDANFLQSAVRRMADDRALMAVGGLFYGEEGGGLLGELQRNEYYRYQRDIKRRRGRPFVLTGTASVFRPAALRKVAAERGRRLPGVPGDVYDTAVLTEDNELTLALKSLGALIVSPAQCTVVTEVMPNWRSLWAQRLRWQRGALENLGAYGFRPATFRYWSQQLGIGYGVIALSSFLLMMTLMALALDSWVWFPFWLGAGLLFAIERVVTVWKGGWPARVLAATVLPELIYALFLDVVYLKGVLDISLGKQASWHHLIRTTEHTAEVTK